MAMRRKMEIRMDVAANPKEMASIDVPKSLSVDVSPALASAAAAGSDGVSTLPPGHGLDLCQDSLMAACFLPRWRLAIRSCFRGSTGSHGSGAAGGAT